MYKKTVKLIKGTSTIYAHLARGKFKKYRREGEYFVDGEFGRSGECVSNNWHYDYSVCKADFLAYVGEKILGGYTIAEVTIEQ